MPSALSELRSGITTGSAEHTREIAARLAHELSAGTVLALHGNLGAGKTTFTQGFAKGLGIEESVTSPTFTIFTLHRGGGKTLLHLDAYRLNGTATLDELMIDDFLVTPWWMVIEWPENVAAWLPSEALHLELGINSDETHTIRLL